MKPLTAGTRDFGVPLVVLTAKIGAEDVDPQRKTIMIHRQGELARRSSRGSQVVVDDSDHLIPCEAPQTVIDAVHEVVDVARSSL